MSNNPDEIRSNIEETRRDLGQNVDALADKVSPTKIAERQADKVKGALRSVREHVMGSVSDVHDSASDAVDSVSGAVTDAAHKTESAVKGNPLAVGLIAVGIGWLAASLIPASDAERKLAASAKDAAQPLIDDLATTAKGVAGDLKAPAQEAFDAVKNTAADAVDSVKAEAADAAEGIKDQAQTSKETVEQYSTRGAGDSWSSQ